MATLAQRRNRRQRIDRSVARAFRAPMRRLFRAEEARILDATATADTIGEWRAAARKAMRPGPWVAGVGRMWLSDALRDVWDAQQEQLGTPGLAMPVEVERLMGDYGAEHGRSIADTNRQRVLALEAPKQFRSTMRRELRELYADWTGDGGRSDDLSFSESLQGTETSRYEAAQTHAQATRTTRLVKVWFTMGDNRVRPTHSRVERRTAVVRRANGSEGTFRVGGASLRYPRDPTGPSAEVINCRCWLEYRQQRRT